MEFTTYKKQNATSLQNLYLLGFHFIYLAYLFDSNIIRAQYLFAYLFIIIFLNIKFILKDVSYFLFFLRTFFVGLACLIIKGFETDVFYALCYFFSIFIIVQFYSTLKVSNRLHLGLMIGYFLMVGYFLGTGVDPNQILSDRSQNMVGFYYLCFVVLYYFEEFKRGVVNYSIYPALSSLVLSLLLFGRSSIVISIFLMIFILYFNLKKSNSLNKLKILLLLSSAVIISLIYLNSFILNFLELGLSRFGQEGTDLTGRSEIWKTYINHFFGNLKNLVFGVPLNSDYIFIKHDRNLHNSYLIAHSFFGLYAFYLFFIIAKSLKFRSEYYFLSFLLILLLIRGFTDGIFFVNYNDYVLFSIVFFINPLKKVKIWNG